MADRKELLEAIQEERKERELSEKVDKHDKLIDAIIKAGFDTCPDCGMLVSKHDKQCPNGDCGTLFE